MAQGFLGLYGGSFKVDATKVGVEGERPNQEIVGRVKTGDPDPEWWIELRETLPQADYEATQRVFLGDTHLEQRANESGAGDMLVKAGANELAYQKELLIRGIVDWNLTDEKGEKLPLDSQVERAASIARLPQAVFIGVYQVLTLLNQPRGAADRTRFQPARADRS